MKNEILNNGIRKYYDYFIKSYEYFECPKCERGHRELLKLEHKIGCPISKLKHKNRIKNKIWCKHIRQYSFKRGWYFKQRGYILEDRISNWKYCPICGQEKPTKENIAARELQFLMDNDL